MSAFDAVPTCSDFCKSLKEERQPVIRKYKKDMWGNMAYAGVSLVGGLVYAAVTTLNTIVLLSGTEGATFFGIICDPTLQNQAPGMIMIGLSGLISGAAMVLLTRSSFAINRYTLKQVLTNQSKERRIARENASRRRALINAGRPDEAQTISPWTRKQAPGMQLV